MNGPFRASPARGAFAEFIPHAALILYHCLTMHSDFSSADAIIDLLLVEPTLTQKTSPFASNGTPPPLV
jgi:hypothetical protein